ncbi:AAA family ATPase [Salmonella enterica subsp. enterica serovar Bareilly]
MSIIEHAPEAAQKKTASKKEAPTFKLRFRQHSTLPESENFLVKGILPRRGIGIVYAPSGTGKTFTGLHLAGAIASHRGHWMGQFAAMGSVIYVSYESGAGLDQRIRAVEIEMNGGAPLNNLIVIEGGILVGEKYSMEALNGLIDEVNQKRPESPVRAVIFDTVSQSMGGDADANSSNDVREYLKHYDALAYRHNLCVIGMAHPGKDLSRGVNGSLVWRNNVDFLILMTRPADSYEVKFSFDKLRDGDRKPILCKLRKVPYEQSLIDVLEANHAAEQALRGGLELPAYEEEARLASYTTLILDDTPCALPQKSSVTARYQPEPDQNAGETAVLLYCLNMKGGAAVTEILRDDFTRWGEKMGKTKNKFSFGRTVNRLLTNNKLVQVKHGEAVWLSLPEAVTQIGKSPDENAED